jgi:prepilin-type N-terminal cleavage/methylation domain-containing protein
MKRRAGFTIVELIITLTIMVILIVLAVVNLTDTLAKGRDEERKTDVANIIIFQESAYNRSTTRSYFPNTSVSSVATIEAYYQNIDRNNLRAPGVTAGSYSLVIATNTTQTAAGVLPQPTNTTYVYQPLESDGSICDPTGVCRKFNIYYREESTGTTKMLTSRSQ